VTLNDLSGVMTADARALSLRLLSF